eukprot:5144606-Amphidinium_carterae.2
MRVLWTVSRKDWQTCIGPIVCLWCVVEPEHGKGLLKQVAHVCAWSAQCGYPIVLQCVQSAEASVPVVLRSVVEKSLVHHVYCLGSLLCATFPLASSVSVHEIGKEVIEEMRESSYRSLALADYATWKTSALCDLLADMLSRRCVPLAPQRTNVQVAAAQRASQQGLCCSVATLCGEKE